jgi:hypothetical protein
MSHQAPTGHHTDPHGSSDAVDYVKVVGVGVASLILFAVSIWWSFVILQSRTAEVEAKTGKSRPALTKQEEIGIVDQVPFVIDKRLPIWKHERSAWLNSYGWIDRTRRIVHIPIEQAMDKVLTGASPEGAPR